MGERPAGRLNRPDPYAGRRAKFRERAEEIRRRLPEVTDPVQRRIDADLIDMLEDLLGV